MTRQTEVILSSETLDAVYRQWLLNRPFQQSLTNQYGLNIQHTTYRYQSRSKTSLNKAFEDWLWDNGFKVIQRDKKRFLKFIGDEKRLTMFLLKYDLSKFGVVK